MESKTIEQFISPDLLKELTNDSETIHDLVKRIRKKYKPKKQKEYYWLYADFSDNVKITRNKMTKKKAKEIKGYLIMKVKKI